MSTIGVIGMGKMGTAISSLLANDPNVKFYTFNRLSNANQPQLKACDVVIEFTTPDAAPDIISHCLNSNVAIVSGTTGWQEYHLERIKKLCQQHNGKFFYASNFSIGMNITFALNRKLASMMNQYPQFKASIQELHHIHKKDAPSGTAYVLIEDIIATHSAYEGFQLNNSSVSADMIPVNAIREGDIKGIHEVTWNSGLEKVSIRHEALDRKIFAEGAILAAQWLINARSGVYTMKDIIGL